MSSKTCCKSNVLAREPSRVEFWLLLLVFLCLPILQAPTAVGSFLFVLFFALRSIETSNWGHRSPFEWPIFGLITVLWIAPQFSEFGDTITAMNSAPRWTLLGLFVIAVGRLQFSLSQLRLILIACFLGSVIAVVDAFYVWSWNGRAYPEMRSVGQVNHSAMYALTAATAALPLLRLNRHRWLQFFAASAVLAFLVYLPPSRSGVGLLGFAVLTSVLLCVSVIKSGAPWRAFLFSSLVMGTIAAWFWMLGGALKDEFLWRIASSDPTSGRLPIFAVAVEVFDRHWLLGSGWGSMPTATAPEILAEELAKSGNQIDAGFAGSGGHNLFITYGIERGAVGLVFLVWLLYSYLKFFGTFVMKAAHVDELPAAAAFSGFLVALGFIVVGMGNTTMINEHGQVGMGILSVIYGYLSTIKGGVE